MLLLLLRSPGPLPKPSTVRCDALRSVPAGAAPTGLPAWRGERGTAGSVGCVCLHRRRPGKPLRARFASAAAAQPQLGRERAQSAGQDAKLRAAHGLLVLGALIILAALHAHANGSARNAKAGPRARTTIISSHSLGASRARAGAEAANHPPSLLPPLLGKRHTHAQAAAARTCALDSSPRGENRAEA